MSSKVKDGLFLGDIDAAQDAEFLQLNGIVHIINCVPRQVPNLFQQSLGLSYVACDLEEVLRKPFFDLKNRQFMGIVQLIDRALDQTESVLVHSLNGLNRSPSVMMGYLMVKYCWGVDKAYEFLLSKRGDLKPHESYIDQLCLLEAQLQTQFGGRATEQQLYEWHASLADPRTDEIVLIHTYLNTKSTVNKKDPGNKTPASRRLSWIDQSPQMKKLYPTLMIKPERPPNHSYSDMLPANGWVDLLTPGHATTAPAPKPIAAFLDTTPATATATAAPSSSSSSSSAHITSGDAMDMDEEDEDASIVNRGRRVHSFSAPKRREIEVEPSNSPLSDREEHDLTIDVANTSTTNAAAYLPRQPVPRHQPPLRSVVATTTPARQPLQQQQPPQQHTQQQHPQQQRSSAVARASAAPGPSLTNSQYSSTTGAIRASPSLFTTSNSNMSSTTMSSSSSSSSSFSKTPATKKVPDYAKPVKPGSRTTAAPSSRTFPLSTSTATPSAPPLGTTTKPSLQRRSSSSSSSNTGGSFSARGSYTSDLPLPQTTSAFSTRRAVVETSDPWATTSTSTTRPRTAPPRMRKKDADATMYSNSSSSYTSKPKSMADAFSVSSISGGISRVTLDVSSLPGGVGRCLAGGDYTQQTASASFRTQKLASRTTTTTPAATASNPFTNSYSASAAMAASAASSSRPKSTRAHWK